MPSGPKKRKSKASKKPKPDEPPHSPQLGDPPELERALEVPMAKDGDETMEACPSPREPEVTSVAMGEGGFQEGEEPIREEDSQRGIEVSISDEGSAPNPDNIKASDPPPQAQEKFETPGPEAPVDTAQGDPSPNIKEEVEAPLTDAEPESDSPATDPKPEVDADTMPRELERDTKPEEADPNEMGSRPHEAQIDRELETDESPVEVKEMADVAREDTEPAVEIEQGVDEAPAEANPVIDAALVDSQPDNDAATVEREVHIDAAPADPQTEKRDEAQVDEADMNPVMDASLSDDQPDNDEVTSAKEHLHIDASSANDKPDVRDDAQADEVPIETKLGNDEATVANEMKDEATVDSQPDNDEATAAKEPLDTDVASANIEPGVRQDAQADEIPVEISLDNDEATVVRGPDAVVACAEIELEEVRDDAQVDEAEMNPLKDAPLSDAQPHNDEAEAVRELEADATCAAIELDGSEDVQAHEVPMETNPNNDETTIPTEPAREAMVDAQPDDGGEATILMESHADDASTRIELEGTENTFVETAAEIDEDPVSVQLQMDEAIVEKQLQTDAVLTDPAADAPQEIEGAPAAVNEPAATDEDSVEILGETEEGHGIAQSEMEEAMVQRQLDTEAGPSNLELEATAASVESEVEKDTVQTGENASEHEIEATEDKASTELDSEADTTLRETELEKEPEADTTLRETELEKEPSACEMKPEADATLADARKDEVPQVETKPELNATVGDTEQVEVSQADIKQQPEEGPSIEVEPDVEVENVYASLDVETDGLKEMEPEPEPEPEPERSSEASLEIEAQTGSTPQQDEQVADKAQPASETSIEASETLIEASELFDAAKDPNGGVQTPLEADTEAESEVPQLETQAEVLTELKPDRMASHENESNQQDLAEVGPGSAVEAPELCSIEADQVEPSTVSGTDEASLVDGSTSSVPVVGVVADSDADAGTNLPAAEHENTGKLEDGDAADIEVVTDNENGAVDGQAEELKGYIIEQQRTAVGDTYDEEKVSLGQPGTTVVPSEQDSSVEVRPAMAVAEEVSLKEGPCVQDMVADQSQLTLDKQELTMDPRFIDESSGESEMVEQGLNTTLPKSEMAEIEYEPKGLGDSERDIGEEEAASSTVAEAGSVLNDIDESVSYQHLPTDFPSSEQDEDPSWSTTPELIDMGLTEQTDDECRKTSELIETGLTEQEPRSEQEKSPASHSQGEDGMVSVVAIEDFPKHEVEWKASQDFEVGSEHEEVLQESAKAGAALSLPAINVNSCDEGNVLLKEVCVVEAGAGGHENGQGGSPPGIVPALESSAVREDEWTSKVSPSDIAGQNSLPGLEASTHSKVMLGEEAVAGADAAVKIDEAEIHTMEATDLKTAACIQPVEKDSENKHDGAPLKSADPGKCVEEVQAFHQQNTQEASLPVVVPVQDVKQRSLEKVNVKGNELPGGPTLERRSKWLGCCGMLDVLLGKN